MLACSDRHSDFWSLVYIWDEASQNDYRPAKTLYTKYKSTIMYKKWSASLCWQEVPGILEEGWNFIWMIIYNSSPIWTHDQIIFETDHTINIVHSKFRSKIYFLFKTTKNIQRIEDYK